jgi:hypothetical protein
MLDILKSIIGTVAPALATAIAGPAGGLAVSLISQKLFGKGDASVPDIIKTLKADPASLVKLQELETQVELAKLGIASKGLDIEAAGVNGQLLINQKEAEGTWFQSSWRPCIGWVGAIALLNNYILIPYLSVLFNVDIPSIDIEGLYPLIFGLLGFGAFRSYEKVKTK